MTRVQIEVNDEGPRRIRPDDMVWLSIEGQGRGMTVSEWLTVATRVGEWPARSDLSPVNPWGSDGGTIT